jgi:hypothetical protein
VDLRSRIKWLESQVIRTPHEEVLDLTEEELEDRFIEYFDQRDRPGGVRDEEFDRYLSAYGFDNADDVWRERELDRDQEAGLPRGLRKWAIKPSGRYALWPMNEPLPEGWRYDQASV